MRGDPSLGAVLLAGDAKGKASLLLALSPSVVGAGHEAGALMGEIAKTVGGRGGGTARLAQAGGKEPRHIARALETGRRLLEEAFRGSSPD